MDDFSPNRFEDVFSAELEEIAKRQEKPNGEAVDRKELAGIALSGGGIRAATSALGVLQALKKLGQVLSCLRLPFDQDGFRRRFCRVVVERMDVAELYAGRKQRRKVFPSAGAHAAGTRPHGCCGSCFR